MCAVTKNTEIVSIAKMQCIFLSRMMIIIRLAGWEEQKQRNRLQICGTSGSDYGRSLLSINIMPKLKKKISLSQI